MTKALNGTMSTTSKPSPETEREKRTTGGFTTARSFSY